MSKQLKLRFKKLIKKAEFVSADLEYHEELAVDAKRLFREAINKERESFSTEEKEKLNKLISERERLQQERFKEYLKNRAQEQKEDEEDNVAGLPENHPDVELLPQDDDIPPAPVEEKSLELKKIFHKIAAATHPDKTSARGLVKEEAQRLEKIFKRARAAHDEGNWYILYCIAADLNIVIDNISDDHLDWVEEDIRSTLAKIARVANLVAWSWYTGSEPIKILAIKNYFFQLYGYDWNPEEPTD
jgi:hypothetical protein